MIPMPVFAASLPLLTLIQIYFHMIVLTYYLIILRQTYANRSTQPLLVLTFVFDEAHFSIQNFHCIMILFRTIGSR